MYTKGEWVVNRDTGVSGVCGIEVSGSPIASVNLAIPEVEANVNLIAAAPDMYEALKAIDDYLSAPYPENMKLKQHAANLLIAALAKAEGSL